MGEELQTKILNLNMSVRKFFVGGNWKCNGVLKSIEELVNGLNKLELPSSDLVEILVAPTSLHLSNVKSNINSRFHVSAQNAYPKSGAFTGEVDVAMLKDSGIDWVILGHSERRNVFNESEQLLSEKLIAAQNAGLNIVYCIGESEKQRENNETQKILESQLKPLIENANWSKIVVAYEPVWAIGTGKTATPELAQETHKQLRDYLKTATSEETASKLRIIYGGSVKPANCDELAACADIDGFLVRGASLKAETFGPIINSASKSQ